MFMQARLKKRDRKQCTESWGVPDLRDKYGSGKVSLDGTMELIRQVGSPFFHTHLRRVRKADR